VQTVTCVSRESLAAGASTTLNLTVAVALTVASPVNHAPRVDVEGDPVPSNNTTTERKTVAFPTVNLLFNPEAPSAGSQPTFDVTLTTPFAHDATGTLRLAFSPNAAIPADDPAIQFATGGREVTFTIPANTLQARFGANPEAGPIGFQTGTVAGTLSFTGTLQTGDLQTPFSISRAIPRQAPTVHSVQQEGTSRTSFSIAINLFSTPREVTQLILRFNTTPPSKVSCGSVTDCSSSGDTLPLDVKSMFDNWFATHPDFGSSSSLRVPLSIDGNLQGTAVISLRNSMGTSNSSVFPLP